MPVHNTKDLVKIKVGKRILLYSLLCLAVLFITIFITASVGSARIPLGDTYRILFRSWLDTSDVNPNFLTIVYQVRLPRIFLAVLVGMALSAAGVMYQGLFRNPMADPYIIGVSSGASVAAALAIVTGLFSGFLGFSGLMVAAFLGALLVSLLVFTIARSKNRYMSVLKLILSGIAVGALCSAATSFLMLIGREEMHQIVFWVMGSLTTAQWDQVVIIAPVIFTGVVLLFFLTKDLNILAMSEQRAQQLGVNTERLKNLVIILSSLIVAAAVSVSGIIGFIGLVIPHIMRILVGPDNRILFPVSALVGGIVLLIADTLARTVMIPREIPVGIITALLGGPFFIYLLTTERRRIQM